MHRRTSLLFRQIPPPPTPSAIIPQPLPAASPASTVLVSLSKRSLLLSLPASPPLPPPRRPDSNSNLVKSASAVDFTNCFSNIPNNSAGRASPFPLINDKERENSAPRPDRASKLLLSAGRQLAGWEAGQKDMEGYGNVSDQRDGTYFLFPLYMTAWLTAVIPEDILRGQ